MIVATSDEIAGKKIVKTIGIVEGSTVRAKNIGRDIAAGFKNIIGGEVKGYTDLMKQAREEAYNRMVNDAQDKGGDAVVGMRFTTSMISQGTAEILAFGTAVKLK
jgi:uncharacterized protein YbjQ (UPF0145 family)